MRQGRISLLRPVGAPTRARALALVLAAAALSGCGGVPDFATLMEAGREHPAAPLLVLGIFLASGFVAAPLSAVMVPTLVVFGPVEGSAWTLLGASASAALFFKLGARGSALGKRFGLRIPPDGRLARLLESNGILAVAAARNLPLGPYPVVNLALGALPLRFADFMIGNTIGLLPWVLLYALTGAELRAAAAAPNLEGAARVGLAVAGVAGASLGAAYLATRWLGRGQPHAVPPEG